MWMVLLALSLGQISAVGQVASPPVVPKRLDPPAIDGRCGDPAYADALRLSVGRTPARLVHSGSDLIVCLEGIPAAARSVTLWLNPHRLVVRAWPDGRVIARQGTDVELPAAQFRTATTRTSDSWNGEVAVPLAWLGGTGRTGRTAALRLSLDSGPPPVAPVAEWPEPSDEFEPSTWGALALGAPHRRSTRAGSAFVDGFGGYLVMPALAEFSRRPALTLEVTARVVNDDCGTLIGGGFETGYWIGVCDGVVLYRRPGGTYTRRGRMPVTKGWHRIALRVDAVDGERLSVDGRLDLHLQPRGRGRMVRDSRAAPVPRYPWRVGSDAEAPPELDYLHAYVAEVRIGGQRWRFADGLMDWGVVGFASLAAERPDSTPRPRSVSVATAPAPAITPSRPEGRGPAPWDGRLPLLDSAAVAIDGTCRLDEYEDAAEIALEPERVAVVRALLTDSALFVCTGMLVGRQDRLSVVTLYLARDGATRTARGADDLEIQVAGDGSVTILPRDDRTLSPGPDSTRAILAKVVGRARFDLQAEDTRPFALPWWSAEVRIPLTALRPYSPDDPRLRLAINYASASQLPNEGRRFARGRWPRALDPAAPASWGPATVTRETLRPSVRIDLTRRVPQDPTATDFAAACPSGTKHDALYATYKEAKWPMVDPATPAAWVEGTMLDSHISPEDSPFLHATHDVDMHITPRWEDRWLMLEGKSDLVLETELGGLPAQARALPGDRVIALGRWVFDCGHGAKTEIHPINVFVTDRVESRVVRPDTFPQTVRVVRIWFNSKPKPWSYTFWGTFAFRARVPGGPLPFARVVHADSPPTITPFGDSVEIAVTPPAEGKYYIEIVLGTLAPNLYSWKAAPYTVNVDQIDVLNDHDSGAPDCGPVTNLSDCGEWSLAMHLNGYGRTIWNRREVWDEDNPWNIDQTYPVAGTHLLLHAAGYEDDDWNYAKLENFKGDEIGQSHDKIWEVGRLDTLCCGTTRSYTPPGADWKFRFQVMAGADQMQALPPSAHPFWKPRLAEEPNEIFPTPLGNVTPTPAVPVTVTHAASLLEAPLVTGGVHLLGADEDRYSITLGDFAVVTADILEGLPAQTEVVAMDPWFYYMPQTVKDLVGAKSYQVRVTTPGNWGDLPYTLRVKATYRVLPKDWGEAADATADGRVMDLVTPDPAAQVFGGVKAPQGNWPLQAWRRLTKPWAWQHVTGDEDIYTVLIPKVIYPGMIFACQYNEPAAIELKAPNARLVVVTAAGATFDSASHLQINGKGLNTMFPDGKLRVKVLTGPGTQRSVYQLTAEFREGLFYTPGECEERHKYYAKMKARLGTLTATPNEPPFGFPKPGPLELISPVQGALAAYAHFALAGARAVDFEVSGVEQQQVLARLYDLDGVLLAESGLAGGEIPTARLVARGLSGHQGGLLLQIVPAVQGATLGTIGVSVKTW